MKSVKEQCALLVCSNVKMVIQSLRAVHNTASKTVYWV